MTKIKTRKKPKCVVPSCRGNYMPAGRFSLPKGGVVRAKWLEAIGLPNRLAQLRGRKICAKHFDSSAFLSPDFVDPTKRTRKHHHHIFHPNAVPTLHLGPVERGSGTNETREEEWIDVEIIDEPDERKGEEGSGLLNHELLYGKREEEESREHPHKRRKIIGSNLEVEKFPMNCMNLIRHNDANPTPSSSLSSFTHEQADAISTEERKFWLDPFWDIIATSMPPHNHSITDPTSATASKSLEQSPPTHQKRGRPFGSKNKLVTPKRNLRAGHPITRQQQELHCSYNANERSPPTDDPATSSVSSKTLPRLRCKPNHPFGNRKKLTTTQQQNDVRRRVGRPCQKRKGQNAIVDNERKYGQGRARYNALVRELKGKEKETQRILSENAKLKALNEELLFKSASHGMDGGTKRDEQQDPLDTVIMRRYFTEGQIQCIAKGENSTKWSTDDCAKAICLHSVGQKAYSYMRKAFNHPLPSLTALRNWALTEFDISEGFLKDVLILMREKGKCFSPMEKIGVLTFGEMALAHEICFDANLERVIGPCNKVAVIMFRGLFRSWKQPIYYQFDEPINKSVLYEAISLLHEAGYLVVAATCDIENSSVWQELKITEQNHYFPHPVVKDAVVFAFADAPHLLKQLRNGFFDYEFVFRRHDEKFSGAMLQNIIDHQNATGSLPLSHRLTQKVMDARNNFPTAVWPAARIWSRSVAKTVELAGKQRILNPTTSQKLGDFIRVVNDWFDVHNSKKQFGEHRGVDAYGVDADNQGRALLLMNVFVMNIRVARHKKLLPYQEAIIISNTSLRSLHNYLKDKFPNDYKYLITRRLQQDVLENFFSDIRSMDELSNPPSAYDFRSRLRSYLLGERLNAGFNDDRNNEEESNRSYVFADMPNLTVGCPPDENPPSQFSCVLAAPSRSSGGHSAYALPISRRANRYCYDPSLPNSSSHVQTNDTAKSSIHSGLFGDTSGTPCSLEPAYEYEPDPGNLVLITGELFADIINNSSDLFPEDIEHAEDW